MNGKSAWARCYGLVLFFSLILMVTFFISTPAQARKGWYLGGGLAKQSMSGGFEGNDGYMDPGMTVVVAPGKLAPGSGLALLLGYGFNENASLEYYFSSTSHSARFDAPGFPGQSATLSAGIIGPRFSTDSDNLSLFARLGLSAGILTYENAATSDGVNYFEAEFSGGGTGYGVGFEKIFGKWGLEVSFNKISVTFDELSVKTASGTLAGAIPGKGASITNTSALFSYHF
ncbi:MAG: outer membrane beta-barrel protein [Deltaproteobacteria bacterium]|nr:outer membrane beta-barrel protein [Deltaproteobacteria bacterium]